MGVANSKLYNNLEPGIQISCIAKTSQSTECMGYTAVISEL